MGLCLLAKLLMGHCLLAMLCTNTVLIQQIIDTNCILFAAVQLFMGLSLMKTNALSNGEEEVAINFFFK